MIYHYTCPKCDSTKTEERPIDAPSWFPTCDKCDSSMVQQFFAPSIKIAGGKFNQSYQGEF